MSRNTGSAPSSSSSPSSADAGEARASQPTPASEELFSRLEGRQRVLSLQQRRFWRELAFSAAILSADALTIAIVFVTLAQIPFHVGPRHVEFVRGLIPPNPPALLRRITLLLFCLAATRAYSTTDAEEQSGRIALAIVLGVVLPRWVELLSFLFLTRTLLISATVVVLWLSLVAQRRGMVFALQAFDPRRLDQERTLLVGVGQQLRTFLAEHLDTRVPHPPTYEIDPDWPGDQYAGWHTLYEEVHRSRADAIILVGPLSDAALQNVLIAGSSAGCRVFGLRRRPLREMNNPTLIRRGEGPIALLSSPALLGWQLVAKRMLDVTGATIGMVLLSPVLLVCAILVKVTSPGPVFFWQIRVGLGGEHFRMLKLRTMVEDADERLGDLASASVYEDPQLFKVAGDPRITSVGRFLRRSSLDELPQLWNVLRGEMSLVGPRPPLPREVARYKVRHYVRFEVAPGITGPWQVSGRNEITSFDTIIQLEQEYINGWTVWRDLILLLRTVPAVLSMRGAL
jgi:exopolysaccharide biosynthesis polyprenyl glycosylphosphotransferase